MSFEPSAYAKPSAPRVVVSTVLSSSSWSRSLSISAATTMIPTSATRDTAA